MTDDIVTRLRDDHCTMVFNNHEHWCKALGLMEDAADEIERLRNINTELVKLFKQVGVVVDIWQKSEDELIELHHGKCAQQFAEQAEETKRLQAENAGLQIRILTLLKKLNEAVRGD